MHLILDYIGMQLGGYNGKDLFFIPIVRDEQRLTEQIKQFLGDHSTSVNSLESIILVTEGARFSDVRTATVTANILSHFKSLPLYQAKIEDLSEEGLTRLLKEQPKTYIEPEYSSPPSITGT